MTFPNSMPARVIRPALFDSNTAWRLGISGGSSADSLQLEREWKNQTCRLRLENRGEASVRLAEVVVFDLEMPVAPDTPIYGEGYNMLSQYRGTVCGVENITSLTDAGHYRLPAVDGMSTVYNLLMLFPPDAVLLMGFASCRRFRGEFRFNSDRLEVVINCENMEIKPGATLELESFFYAEGPDREQLLAEFAAAIALHHPSIPYPEIPTGWCSWYAYGPDVTEQDVFDNLAAIRDRFPELKFIQIDDGYQVHMGDWLVPHPNFPRPVKDLCLDIRSAGFEPAIWVAPFIADEESELLQEHPEWFVSGDDGKPLCSADVSFGGWRLSPWFMLDGTHPEAQDYLRHVFGTMRKEWQCRYFKLDANMWGALPFGQRHDPDATCIDAYRAGMRAVLDGVGDDGFVLGCNAPMWPSIGMVHGMRITNDISRSWQTIRNLSEEAFNRNWQHNALWINDPDCLVLRNETVNIMGPDGTWAPGATDVSDDEFGFHAAYVLASGGMVLASDRMMDLTDEQAAVLRKLLPPRGQAAVFDDRTFQVGRISSRGKTLLCLFNTGETDEAIRVENVPPGSQTDFWSGKAIPTKGSNVLSLALPPHSARVIQVLEEM